MTCSKAPLRDSVAFTQVFERHHLAIFRYIYGLSGSNLREIEDLTAETFLRAWKARMRFEGDEQSVLRWLITIARHLVIDNARRQKVRKNELTVSEPDEWNKFYASDRADNPENQTILQEQGAILCDLLAKLPTEKREMLVLHYILGWRVKEIAAYLNMADNTVSVYIRRSLEQLRRNWPHEES